MQTTREQTKTEVAGGSLEKCRENGAKYSFQFTSEFKQKVAEFRPLFSFSQEGILACR